MKHEAVASGEITARFPWLVVVRNFAAEIARAQAAQR